LDVDRWREARQPWHDCRVPKIATIGVYEFDAPAFIRTLDLAGVTQVIDIRQRRGVRGSQYAWANARRLQALLADARIGYEYHPELAPDTELRHLQYRDDDRQGVGKRSRVRLSADYIRSYTQEILDLVPLEPLVRRLPVHGIGALLCVEATAAACHRSLVGQRLADRFGFEVVNLEPVEPTDAELATTRKAARSRSRSQRT
jgi:uncharacterized protein (DUF488 family)